MRRDDPGPYSLDALKGFSIPSLFLTDATQWKRQLVAWFEEATGRRLYPMQVEMLLIETLAYAMSVLGAEGQHVAEQHLVAFADIDGLERLGSNRSTPRLPAAKAQVTICFSLLENFAGRAVYIPAGVRVNAGDGPIFATIKPASIAIGATSVEVIAEAETAGAAANGFLPGQLTSMLDPIAGVAASNVEVSDGGAEVEDVELYRLRLANAFERISTGGSYAWYRETAMGVSSAVVDLAVVRPKPCYVDLYPLTLSGPAEASLRAEILTAFNTQKALDIRFGDEVTIKPPVAVVGAPVLTLHVRNAPPSILADATAAAKLALKNWRDRLGAIVAPSDIEAAVKRLPGVLDAEISNLSFQILERHEFFVATDLIVNIEDEA